MTDDNEVTVQLRRYELEPELQNEYLTWWQRDIVPLRNRYGFRIVFAYLDKTNSHFAWAVARDGNADSFTEAEKAYKDSPDRLQILKAYPEGSVTATVTGLVNVIR